MLLVPLCCRLGDDRRTPEPRLRFRLLLVARGGDKSGDGDERQDCGHQAAVCSAGSAEGGAKSHPHQQVHAAPRHLEDHDEPDHRFLPAGWILHDRPTGTQVWRRHVVLSCSWIPFFESGSSAASNSLLLQPQCCQHHESFTALDGTTAQAAGLTITCYTSTMSAGNGLRSQKGSIVFCRPLHDCFRAQTWIHSHRLGPTSFHSGAQYRQLRPEDE